MRQSLSLQHIYPHACDGGWWAVRDARRSVWGALKFNVGTSMTASAELAPKPGEARARIFHIAMLVSVAELYWNQVEWPLYTVLGLSVGLDIILMKCTGRGCKTPNMVNRAPLLLT
jgi:hypothetical protein